MTYASKSQPLCRCCGTPIAKSTRSIRVRKEPYVDHYTIERPDFSIGAERGAKKIETVTQPRFKDTLYETVLRSKADCQRYTNGTVTAVSYNNDRTVSHFYVWDGESYESQFFCSNVCAQGLGYLMAAEGRCTKAYNDALGKRHYRRKA